MASRTVGSVLCLALVPWRRMDFAGYTPSDAHDALGDVATLREADRAAAQVHFDALMASRARRFAELAALAQRNGTIDIAVDDAPLAVGTWLVPALAAAGPGATSIVQWTSVIGDVALWLGDRMIARAPQLRWELFTSHKKATGYQRPVLVGFSRVDAEHYYVDIGHLVAAWADLAARRRAARADFLSVIEITTLGDA